MKTTVGSLQSINAQAEYNRQIVRKTYHTYVIKLRFRRINKLHVLQHFKSMSKRRDRDSGRERPAKVSKLINSVARLAQAWLTNATLY